jgi:hypothetical protein
MTYTRRDLLHLLSAAPAAAVLGASPLQAQAAKTRIVVYKDPNCGCCANWIDHMQANGYLAAVTNTAMDPIKKQFQVPASLASCHTTLVGGYVVEGHVPAGDVTRLLTEKPKNILGLTIPGMPASAPGMDQRPFQAYTVLTFDAQGKTTVFARHDR